MVKRRKAKVKRRSSRNGGILGKLSSPITGAIVVVGYESLISPMISNYVQGTSKDLVELGIGLYLSKRSGILGAGGKALVYLNAYQLISGLVGNKLTGLIGSEPTIDVYNTGGY